MMNAMVVYEPKIYTLYVHVNQINGKRYFGITKRRTKERWGKNGEAYKHCRYFYKAIQKYGWNSFLHIVILNKLTESEACFLEDSYIQMYRSSNSNYGYNLQSGGKLGKRTQESLDYQKQHSDTKRVICLETKKIYKSATTLELELGYDSSSISKVCRSLGRLKCHKKHYLYFSDYKKLPKEEIEKIKNGDYEYINLKRKPVICLETLEEFESTKAASIAIGCAHSSLQPVLENISKGKRGSVFGKHYAYLKDYKEMSQEFINFLINPPQHKERKKKKPKVKLVSVNPYKEYVTYAEARRDSGLSESIIKKCCKNRIRYNETLWLFYNDYKEIDEKKIIELLSAPIYKKREAKIKPKPKYVGVKRKSNPIICIETKKVYLNKEDFRRDTLYQNYAYIKFCCDNIDLEKGGYKASNFHWLYLEDYKNFNESDFKKLLKERDYKNAKKEVVCLETGKVYKSLREATSETKANEGNIVTCCRRKRGVSGNLHWLYLNDYKKMSKQEINSILNFKLERPRVKKVICLETNEIYKSPNEASRFTGVSQNSIKRSCRNKFIKKGFHWLYLDDYEKMSKDEVKNLLEWSERNTRNMESFQKKVICLETGIVYASEVKAGSDYGVTGGAIYRACVGDNNVSAGKHWMFLEDYKSSSKEEIKEVFNKKDKKFKKVVHLETGNIYESLTEASACYGNISPRVIGERCLRDVRGKLAKDWSHWRFKQDYDKLSPRDIEDIIKGKNIKRESKVFVKVKCIETNKIYESITEAYKETGVTITNIIRSCKDKNKTSGGYHWEYVDK